MPDCRLDGYKRIKPFGEAKQKKGDAIRFFWFGRLPAGAPRRGGELLSAAKQEAEPEGVEGGRSPSPKKARRASE